MSKQLDSILGRATRATPPPEPVATAAPEAAAEDARALQALVADAAAPAPAKNRPAPAKNRSAPAKNGKGGPGTPAAKPRAASRPARRTAPPVRAEAPTADLAPAQNEPQRPIQAIVPVSVARALAIRAATEDTTVRDLILRGLAAIGLDVPEHECRDRRR